MTHTNFAIPPVGSIAVRALFLSFCVTVSGCAAETTFSDLAGCAKEYDGFETCCEHDPETGKWHLIDAPCRDAVQCSEAVDCPAGFIEMLGWGGHCVCRPALTGTCVETSPIHVIDECPLDQNPSWGHVPRTHRCPTSWPPGRFFECTSCPCEAASMDLPIQEPKDCPADFDQEGCPCAPDYSECCLGSHGLVCSGGVWSRFWDGPCGPRWCRSPPN
ncbi:MAG TPA: hypothetical protein PK095_18970 [Myxococcota bacterium]|nr:hypothetical protein [Myxococcota bacterium]